jgi:serpin B
MNALSAHAWRWFAVFSTVIAAIAIAQVVEAEPKPKPPAKSVQPSPRTANDPSRAPDDAFAHALFAKLAAAKGNVVVSPTSVESCVLLALAGAGGQTSEQMSRMLHVAIDPTKGDAQADIGRLLDRYVRQSSQPGQNKPAAGLVIANSVWIERSLPIRPRYETLLRTNGRAKLEAVDFRKDAESARRAINAWVDAQTEHKITELLPPGALDDSARLVLANAIYFKGGWLKPFDKDATEDRPFHVPGAADATVPLMHSDSHVRYLETADYQAIELPYADSDIAMAIWLPRRIDAIADVERQIGETGIAGSLKELGATSVDVFLPRFKIDTSTSLVQTLSALGMQAAFTDAADFSGISDRVSGEPLRISAVVHQALVDVDEVGTEAAAATGAVAVATAAFPGRVEKKVFRADHPFLFAIRNRISGDVLFMGRLSAPAR